MSERVLTEKEQITNIQTKEHINNVRKFIRLFSNAITERGELHDATKLKDPELEGFTITTERLKGSTYGSKEYQGFLDELKPVLEHHYANNRHHPEHYANGVDDMTLIDIIEMFCDWKAATLRHNDGNLLKSIEINTKRFNINPQLEKIFKNTASLFDVSLNSEK